MHHLGMVLLLTVVYFGQNVRFLWPGQFYAGDYQVAFRMSDTMASVLASAPLFDGIHRHARYQWHSDKTSERPWHVFTSMALLGCGLLVSSLVDQTAWLAVFVMIFWVGPFIYAHIPLFGPSRPCSWARRRARIGHWVHQHDGNLGSSLGPYLVGEAKTTDSSFAVGLLRLAPWPIMSALVIGGIALSRRRTPPATSEESVEPRGLAMED